MASIPEKRALFKRISEGEDKAAFDAFFGLYYPKLIQFARIFVYSEQQAEDIVSDVLTSMLIHRKKVFTLKNFDAYLYSSVKNKALSYIKKLQVREEYAQEKKRQDAATFIDPHDLLEGQEFKSLISNFINGLPPKRQMVFRLVREDGLSYNEVAELLDISDRTVEVHLRLAIKALREKVQEYLLPDYMRLIEN